MSNEVNLSRRLFLKRSVNAALYGSVLFSLPGFTASLLENEKALSDFLFERMQGYRNGMQSKNGIMTFGHNYGRIYIPSYRMFNAPDPESPFGMSTHNRYQYSGLDPINQEDPTGHSSYSLLAIVGITLGIITIGLGAIAVMSSLSAIAGIISTAAVGTNALVIVSTVLSATAALSAIASGALAVASGFTSKENPGLSERLGDAALGLGVISTVFSITGLAIKMSKFGDKLAAIPIKFARNRTLHTAPDAIQRTGVGTAVRVSQSSIASEASGHATGSGPSFGDALHSVKRFHPSFAAQPVNTVSTSLSTSTLRPAAATRMFTPCAKATSSRYWDLARAYGAARSTYSISTKVIMKHVDFSFLSRW